MARSTPGYGRGRPCGCGPAERLRTRRGSAAVAAEAALAAWSAASAWSPAALDSRRRRSAHGAGGLAGRPAGRCHG
eukprot:5811503-Lingulodinium_polyedra.AAC.1